MGLGEAEKTQRLDSAIEDLSLITGQRPVVTKAKKSICFAQEDDVGIKVTLRGDRMYAFWISW